MEPREERVEEEEKKEEEMVDGVLEVSVDETREMGSVMDELIKVLRSRGFEVPGGQNCVLLSQGKQAVALGEEE